MHINFRLVPREDLKNVRLLHDLKGTQKCNHTREVAYLSQKHSLLPCSMFDSREGCVVVNCVWVLSFCLLAYRHINVYTS